ncbi:hypothetical protein L208DRAFT_1462450 [Tricholoma matsutake]|nr:hypothetical protein L208DRAFT_1462450 [Tricholoma matsutake 945]
MTNAAYITPLTPQASTSMSARDGPYALSRPFPALTHDEDPGAANTQEARPTFTPTPYLQASHLSPAATTVQLESGPPPLNFSRSLYRRIPLPDITSGPSTIHPILAYSKWSTAQNEQSVSPGRPVNVRQRHHICTPATNPSVGTITILLPNGQGITVQACHMGHSFVTVGDVLHALDILFLREPSSEPLLPIEAPYSGSGGWCPCQSGTTAVHLLRDRYEWAGLTRSEEGFDIWDLQIGWRNVGP